jgi:hypothetical protein
MRIVQRFVRLVGNKCNVPLRVYQDANVTIRYITASLIETTFRTAAAHVYKVDPVKDGEHLRKWSAHSIRVGACVNKKYIFKAHFLSLPSEEGE